MVLILLPLTTTASRLHAHTLDAPDLATEEMNRCMRLIRIAASKRQTGGVATRGYTKIKECPSGEIAL